MSNKLSRKERRLQFRYIPINIFVCIVCAVAMFTLFFAPIVKIDVGKILRNEGTIAYVDKILEDTIGDNLEDTDQKGVDYVPVVERIVHDILGKAEGSVRITASGAMKVAFSSGDEKAQKVLDELLFGEKALVTRLVDSIVDGVGDLFETDEGKAVLEQAVVSAVTTAMVQDDNLAENLTEENISALTSAFKGLETVENGNVAPAMNAIIEKVEDIKGSKLSDDDKEALTEEVQKLYDQTAAALNGAPVTLEAFICVAISSNVDLKDFNINNLLKGLLPDGDEEGALHRFKSVEDEISEEAGEETPPAEDTPTEEPPVEEPPAEDNPPVEEPPATQPSTGSGESEPKGEVVTTYPELLAQMGFGEDEKQELKSTLKDSLNTKMNEIVEPYSTYFGYYGYVFYVMLVFIVLWGIQLLFAFLHIFTANKRFSVWYTSLLCWIPSIIWIIVVAVPSLLPVLAGELLKDARAPLVMGIISGIGSSTWINGVCYILIILTTWFWAAPKKKAIKSEHRRHELQVKELMDEDDEESEYDDDDDYYDDDDDYFY